MVDADAAEQGVPADRAERLLASIVDAVASFAITLPAIYLAGAWDALMVEPAAGVDEALAGFAWASIGLAVTLVLQGYPLARYGQSWGKRLVGIRIVDRTGCKPSLARLVLLRSLSIDLLACIPYAGYVVPLADILLIFRGDRRCGHDHIAGTWVVKARTGVEGEGAAGGYPSAARNGASAASSASGA